MQRVRWTRLGLWGAAALCLWTQTRSESRPVQAVPKTPEQKAPVQAARPTGIQWMASFAAAREKARKEGKPVLLLHLFGRLDEEFC